MMKNQHLFDGQRMRMDEAIVLTTESLRHYGKRYQHWAIAYSGGRIRAPRQLSCHI